MQTRNRIFLLFTISGLLLVALAACSILPGSQAPTLQVVKQTVLVIVTTTPAPGTATPAASPQSTGSGFDATGTPEPAITATLTPTLRPTLHPSPTPLLLMNVPIEGGDPNHKFYVLLVYPNYQPAATTSLWFRVYAHEPSSSQVDGKNIDNVTFSITDGSGVEVYFREEKTAGYCAFGGGEPNCNVYDFASHNYTWDGPNGVKFKMKSGKFDLHVIATDVNQNVMFGDTTFSIKVP